MTPLFPIPQLIDRPWGGSALARWGKELEGRTRVGESWDVALREGVDSRLESIGTDTPATLGEAFASGAWELFGTRGDFPMLIKTIDARETLSMQVHPRTDSPGLSAKTECWYVLEPPTDGHLYAGVLQATTGERLVEDIAAGRIDETVARIRVRAGDVVLVPSGTVHAATGGMVFLEIQQNSDSTFRIFDWNRPGLDGKPRHLHLAEAAACATAIPQPGLRIAPFRLAPERELLCATPFFALGRWTPGTISRLLDPERFHVLACVAAETRIGWTGGERRLLPGQCTIVPRGCPVEVEGGTLLDAWMPDLRRDVVEPILARGGTAAQARALGAGTWEP